MNLRAIKESLRQASRAQSGMTLIEIMVVVAIMGMLATLVTVYVIGQQEEAKVDGTKIQMRTLVEALEMYKVKYNSFPTTEQGLQELVTRKLMRTMPKDTWGGDFQYVRNNLNSFSLKSLGADGIAGGEGANMDLVEEQ